MNSSNIFFETPETPEIIVNKLKKGEWNDILNSLCKVDANSMYLDYIYFKYFATKETYGILTNYIMSHINNILLAYDAFTVHVNMKTLTVLEIDKHMTFIQSISALLKESYSNKMNKCYVYNATFVFSKVLKLVSLFIDPETQQKIEVVTK
jgi:hypothetical protein